MNFYRKLKQYLTSVVEALITITKTKYYSLQELDFNRSVYMAAICYNNSIWTIYSKIVPLPWTVIHAIFICRIYRYRITIAYSFCKTDRLKLSRCVEKVTLSLAVRVLIGHCPIGVPAYLTIKGQLCWDVCVNGATKEI